MLSNYFDSLASLTLRQLQVLLQSGLTNLQPINHQLIKTQQALLIYFHQLEQRLLDEQNNENFQEELLNTCTKLLDQQFQTHIQQGHHKQQSHDKYQYDQTAQSKDKFEEQQDPDHQQVFIQGSRLLCPQILNKILNHFPKASQLINYERINKFSFTHSQRILELVIFELQRTKFQSYELTSMVQNIVLPILFHHPSYCLKAIQIIKTVMNYFDSQDIKKTKIIESLSQVVTQFYCQINDSMKQLTTDQIIALMTAIEAIHSTKQTYHPLLAQSKHFLSHINKLLLCSNVDSKNANPIAVNMYGALLKQLNLYCYEAEIFINLYSTLRCFGAHLVKDLWSLFYDFIEIEGNDLIFTKAELIDIIFYKIQHHQNANVVKHCIQSILQEQRSYILFKKVPDAIFNSLMRILNYGMHYLDCLFHMDSKMFPMISNFFSNFFNNPHICPDESIENHMKFFLKSIFQKISFDHAFVAMLHSFTLIVRRSHAVKKQELQWISVLIKKYYVKFPIRKRHQMMNGICSLLKNHLNSQKRRRKDQPKDSENLVNLQYLIKNCMAHFPEQYIVLRYNGEQKRNEIFQIIHENFTIQQINETLHKYCQTIGQILQNPSLSNEKFTLLKQTLQQVQLIFYITEQKYTDQNAQNNQNMFNHFQLSTIESLKNVYLLIHDRFVIDLGQSLYKTKQQRIYGMYLQKACLEKLFVMKSLVQNLNICEFIEKTLTNVSLLIKDYIEGQTKSYQIKEEMAVASYLVTRTFEMIYEFSRQNDKEMEDKACRIGSQFLEWATDNIDKKQCHQLLLTALKTRVKQSKQFTIEYIEQSIYNIFWSLFAIEYKQSSISKEGLKQPGQKIIPLEKLDNISPLYRLRLFVVCGTILFDDENQLKKFYPSIISNIDELADRYDYQNLDQIFIFIGLTYTCPERIIDSSIAKQIYNDDQQNYTKIQKLISSVIQTMLSTLNYGVDTKQVIACTTSVLNITFNFASTFRHFSPELIQLCIKVLYVGQEYWMFEKMISFKTIQNLKQMIQKHDKIDYKELFPLLSKILCVQEYRGYDSAIALQNQLIKDTFYTELKLITHLQADYEGLTCRLAFIEFINSLIEYSMTNAQNHHKSVPLDEFLQQFFFNTFNQVKKVNNDKMFMTGEHKNRLKLWQCLISFHPDWIYQRSKKTSINLKFSMEDVICDCIEVIDENNNLAEVKYYIELFLMKMLINSHSEQIISERILNLLSDKLLGLISQLNKNVSFIVIGGLIMNHMFKTYQLKKGHHLCTSLQRLCNALLAYSCSHIAYFRGLSQYFCLETLFIESQYTQILHKTIGKDPDTIILRDKLDFIIKQYQEEILYWNVRNNLFKQLPSVNGNIISTTFYMDRMKRLGQQLLRQIKGELGFLPYKSIWLQAVNSLESTRTIQQGKQKQSTQMNNQQQPIFQRKIDPSLDFIYFSKTKLQGFQMKILITGSQSIPIYGHLSRTGEIFGLSQLVLPYKEIIEDEEYKNVACTAEKWLNITTFSNKTEIHNKEKFTLSLQKQLLSKKQEGYTFFLLKKHDGLDFNVINKQLNEIHSKRKILLILDSQNYLPDSSKSLLSGIVSFGKYFSQHVEASIFIWQYFKEIYGQKFRAQEQQVF